eukprot:g2105.t1
MFGEIDEAQLQKEAQTGHVWLDYSCVPQAAAAQEDRLKAIESIPHYIDASTTFMALCPPVTHKELGHKCDYHTWRRRGWCRLEEQVNELKLFSFTDTDVGQAMGLGKGVMNLFDVPRRPLMILNEHHITCVDMFDHFYMLGVRSQSVMNGDFACCSLGHKKTFDDGTVLCLPCDKDRIKPFCKQMWERKSNHFMAGSPFTRHIYAWRYISHMKLMMATTPDDTPENNEDPLINTLEDVKTKYFMGEECWQQMMLMAAYFPMKMGPMGIQKFGDFGQMGGKETVADPDGLHPPILSYEDNMADLKARGDRLAAAVQQEGDEKYVSTALAYMVAEGDLRMVKRLVETYGPEKGADVTLGMPWAMCTSIDFAAGKGHVRVLRYLLEQGATCDLNRRSNMNLIGAVDRAAKGGFVDALDLLVEFGAQVKGVRRRDGETPAHGAAMHGHIEMLKRLKELGCDLQCKSYDGRTFNGAPYVGKTPLDCAKYYYQTACVEYLEADAKAEAEKAKARDEAKE